MASSSAAAASTTTTRTTAPRCCISCRSQQEAKASAGVVATWSDLPSDLYGQILRRLRSHRDRVVLAAVCRHWHVCAWQHRPGGAARPRLPVRVTRTRRGSHVVVHVRGFSRLPEQLHQQCGGGFVDSPAFAVAGLQWAVRIRYYPAMMAEEDAYVGVFVRLVSEGVVARAYVGLMLVDQTTGLADTVVRWDERPAVFDAAASVDDCCARGGRVVATWSELVARSSRFVRGDCLKIECVIDVCPGRS